MSANEARRRTDPTRVHPKADNTRPYGKEDLDENSIRLIEIHPATHDGDPVICILHEVTFGSQPIFEALSYMWGTGEEDNHVTLNGFQFSVRKNLLDALIFLRRQVGAAKQRQLFWVDTICINQHNVEERNRQLRIMDQIYFRASTVVVWLGSRYTEFQERMPEASNRVFKSGEKQQEEETTGRGRDTAPDGNRIQLDMARQLCKDPYWNRLWVIQEIGRAWRLRVCFGQESLHWEDFMHFLNMHNSSGSSGPLKIHRLLREERYNDSHTLKRLLEEHKDAECSEPRDKVYGLIGLAIDAAGFPMDYTKSLHDVWKDTMHFMNRRGLFKQESQILPIGRLVKASLMQNHNDPWSQISGKSQDTMCLINDTMGCLTFRLEAVVLGCINHVGPSTEEIVSQPKQASIWRAATQRVFPGDELGLALQEHDILLRALLEPNGPDMEAQCFNRPSTVVWGEDTTKYPNATKYSRLVQNPANRKDSQVLQEPVQYADKLPSVQNRLYLAKNRSGSTTRKMGVASALVQPGDLVCWVQWSRRALLVRVVHEGHSISKLRVFGTAMTTEDVCGWHLNFDYAKRWSSLKGMWHMPVAVDAGTVFMLLD